MPQTQDTAATSDFTALFLASCLAQKAVRGDYKPESEDREIAVDIQRWLEIAEVAQRARDERPSKRKSK